MNSLVILALCVGLGLCLQCIYLTASREWYYQNFVKNNAKQIPEKLLYEADGYADGELVYDTAVCPSCERRFEIEYEEQYNYCPECGQRLDWTSEELSEDGDSDVIE